MALKPKALYIAFDKGLDTYGNPHVIDAGKLTAASGVSIDRPGYVYPGPTLGANFGTGALYQNATERYGLASYVASQPTAQDTVLAWTAQADGSFPFRPIAESQVIDRTTAKRVSFQPVRQATSTIFSANNAAGVPPGVPGACGGLASGVQIIAYAWVAVSGSLFLMRQNALTGASETLYTIAPFNGGTFTSNRNSGTQNGYKKVALCSDAAGIVYVVAVRTTGGFEIYSITGALNNLTSTLLTVVLSGLVTADTISAATNTTAYVSYLQSTGSPGLYAIQLSSASTLTPVLIVPGTAFASTVANAAFTSWLDLSVNGTTAATFGAAVCDYNAGTVTNNIITGTTDVNLGSPVVRIFSLFGPNSIDLRYSQISIVTSTSLTTNSVVLNIAIDSSAGFIHATGAALNNLYFGTYDLSTSTFLLTGTYSTGAGSTLVGKGTSRLATVSGALNAQDVVFPIRTGWYSYDNGPVAYPNGYLLNMSARVVAKWGDSDYGHPTLWPQFSSATYVPAALPILSQAVVMPAYQLTDHTTIWPWPQLNYAEGINTTIAPGAGNVGIPINPTVAISTVRFIRDKSGSVQAQSRQLGNTTLFAAGLSGYFDGADTFESGFLARATYPQVAIQGGGNLTPSSTYYYVYVYRYADASGRIHYSAPSLPAQINTGSNPPGSAVTHTIAPFSETLKGTGLAGVQIQIYRTLANPGATSSSSIAYYLADNNVNLSTSTGNGPTNFVDNMPDTVLSQNSTLYTYGQAGNAAAGTKAPPPFDSVTSWQNAFWGVCNRNGPELWFTWPLDNSPVAPEAPSWSSANRVPLPADLGQPLAIVGLDSNLIIFGTNADYALSGSLPQRNSSLADEPGLLSAPTKLPTPGGLKVRNGITFLPTGILFQGTQGFTLLDRSLSYQPVGLPVRNLTNAGLYGPGVLYPEQGCCILPPADGISPPLAYYYFEDKWSTPAYTPAGTFQPGTAPSAPSLTQWQAVSGAVRSRLTLGVPQVVAFEPDVTKPGINVLQPGGGYLQARTPWMEMEQSSVVGSDIASVAGYGQLEEVQIQGDLLTPISHTITLQTEYDYAGNTQTPPDVQVITNVVPEVGPATAPSAPDWQFRLGFKTTLARRVRFTLTFQVTDLAVLAAGDPVVLISGLMLYYGVDDGLSRMGSSGAGYGS